MSERVKWSELTGREPCRTCGCPASDHVPGEFGQVEVGVGTHAYAPGRRDELNELAYVWAWAKWPCERWGEPGKRKGQRCRALAFGRRNSVLVEFEDGVRVVTSRYGLRRKP